MSNPLNSLLSIAPMIDWTNTHFRLFMRLLAPHALLYTEMQTVGAIQNNPQRALGYGALEHPIALQLGGSDPEGLSKCALIAEDEGYDEVNLNLGCPSDKVQAGRFGACLMNEPDKVADCIKTIKKSVAVPVTAKTRIGIDEQDSYDYFRTFVFRLIDAGCDKLIVHARKAWLNGLNPKQNRTIPPVNYDYVYQIKQELGTFPVIINGNVTTIEQIKHHLSLVDGVMLGRLACDNPYRIAEIHHALYPHHSLITRRQIFNDYNNYLLNQHHQNGVPLSVLIKPLFNLTHGMSGARQWKKKLMELLQTKDIKIIHELEILLADMELCTEKEVL